jgi:hypothetical protein
MKSFYLELEAAMMAALLTACAHVEHSKEAPTRSFPTLLNTPEVVVVGSSIEIGRAGNSGVKITRYQSTQSTNAEWAVVLGVPESVYLRPQEIPPLIDGMARLLEVPREIEGYDEVAPRYTTRTGNLKISRLRQPGKVVGGVVQYVGIRYQVNEWYTNDVNEFRRLKQLIEDAYHRLQTLQ